MQHCQGWTSLHVMPCVKDMMQWYPEGAVRVPLA
jgi:hypothetical protein